MTYEYKKDQFLRNKISGNIVQLRQDTNKLDLNIWEIWMPRDGEWCWSKGTMVRAFIFRWTKEHVFEEDRYEPWTKNLPFGIK